jgi:hypothetical protein
MTTGEQEHTRGDPRRGRPARYAHCAPLAAYLLTWPLRPPGDTTRHPYTAAHPMAKDHPPRHHHQCKTMPPPPSRIQKPSAAAAYPEQQLLQWTHGTSWQHNQAPTHSHYLTAQDRPPQCYHQHRTTCPTDKHVHAQHHGIAISTLSISTQTSAFDIHQTNQKSVRAVSNENISSLVVRLQKLSLVNRLLVDFRLFSTILFMIVDRSNPHHHTV